MNAARKKNEEKLLASLLLGAAAAVAIMNPANIKNPTIKNANPKKIGQKLKTMRSSSIPPGSEVAPDVCCNTR